MCSGRRGRTKTARLSRTWVRGTEPPWERLQYSPAAQRGEQAVCQREQAQFLRACPGHVVGVVPGREVPAGYRDRVVPDVQFGAVAAGAAHGAGQGAGSDDEAGFLADL